MTDKRTFRLVHDTARQGAIQCVMRAPDGYVVDIREPTRTHAQNDKMWAVLTELSQSDCEGRGWSAEQWKTAIMAALKHEPVWQARLDGDGYVCTGFRSSRLSVRDMSDVIEMAYAHGALHGVTFKEDLPMKDAA